MIVIQDSREKDPWYFELYEQVTATEVQGLKTGDYTVKEILELEERLDKKILTVERKRSTSEIAQNLGKEKDRFHNELERMTEYEYRYLILEFPKKNVFEFPKNSGIPKHKWKWIRMNGNYMASQLGKIETDYDIRVIFCNDKIEAQDFFVNLANGILDAYTNKR